MKRSGASPLTQIVSGLMAVVALGGCLLAKSPPLESLAYGLGAFVVGRVLGGLWAALFPVVEPPRVEADAEEGAAEGHRDAAA